METKIIKALISEISKYGSPSEIEMNLSFEDDLNMNEYKLNDLLEILEEEFNMELLSFADNFIRVGDLVGFVEGTA
ncbi:hypothetical protein SAMN02745751_02727 [Dethiosulfatibacter aminovorans DSM 17477]|uniref:Acyl carrier protein n=1 Tax=Dethiosulfatibacter aminovorans DSM 17477 TaxID=1121476 RepID=A0A1M6JVX5_9FIRM|nr:hypothetical protein [Dethiosulfatibacter aminovorans]SHJ50847.1 hypothetical protein SAMN02745751_02727 [Dethiosulfatibacter aminovorans DSM 17477]